MSQDATPIATTKHSPVFVHLFGYGCATFYFSLVYPHLTSYLQVKELRLQR